ncbi:inositol monophosphatase family protein [Bacillus methanolicus]|uniref:Inositol-1-monophosphatase n=1 Tax=Bacillus methanolicus (strain MGA3 / ATCC 53907) TaxID=796606 RepID=I3E8C0_BACMM|nr:inositol monophosphatase family protein [Bacillus methanolicus]AIE60014.1 Inositol-phosphate phosphatase [Bacillus methanolicus MGA3]EIJ82741.1 inositol monophosphatase [Bacillus methanolicus MGA3]
MQNEWNQILQHIKQWVKEAGEEQLRRMDQPVRINEKSAAIDLVTEMDIWTENFLLNKIRQHYPGHSILTEESGIHNGEEGYKWVIDPIDGTTNYAHGFPLFCISIAVQQNGDTVIGVVYVPALNELYEAVKGQGAFLNGRPIQVSSRKKLNQSVVTTGFPYDRATEPNNNVRHFVNVVTKVRDIRRTGSAAYDLCQVAAGRFDGYWELKLNPWDIEAGMLLVNEAKGKTKAVKQEKGYYVLAGNPYIFEILDGLIDER